MKKIILTLLLIFLSISVFAETKKHVRLIETDGFYFLWCIEGQEVFTIPHSNFQLVIPLAVQCDCNEKGEGL